MMNPEDFEQAEALALSRIGEAVVTQAKLNLNKYHYIHKTGELQNSVTWELDLPNHRVLIGTNKPYGLYMERGTGIHAVDGKGVPYPWHWFDPSGYYTEDGEEGWVWTRGQKPRPWLEPAKRDFQVQYMMRKYARELGVNIVAGAIEAINKEEKK